MVVVAVSVPAVDIALAAVVVAPPGLGPRSAGSLASGRLGGSDGSSGAMLAPGHTLVPCRSGPPFGYFLKFGRRTMLCNPLFPFAMQLLAFYCSEEI